MKRFCCLIVLGWLHLSLSLAQAQHGALDSSFLPQLNFPVNSAVVQPDGKVLAIGPFTNVNGIYRPGFARLETNGAVDVAFSPDIVNPVLHAAVRADGRIYVSGNFLAINSFSLPCVARLQSDGTVDGNFLPALVAHPTTNTPPGPPLPGGPSLPGIGPIGLQSSGKLIIGGVNKITTTSGAALPKVFRLNEDGSIDGGFSLGFAGSVSRMHVLPDDRIILADTTGKVWRFGADGAVDPTFTPALCDAGVYAIASSGDKLLIGGGFTTVNGAFSRAVARLNANGTVDASFISPMQSDFGAQVAALVAEPDGGLVIGGTFTASGAVTRSNLARLTSDGSVDSGFANTGSGPYVYSLARDGEGRTLVAGAFLSIDGTPQHWLARLQGIPVASSGVFLFETARREIFEGTEAVQLKVRRLVGSHGIASVTYATVAATADAGTDFVAATDTLVFADGETEKTIAITLVDDTEIEDFEFFTVVLNDASGGAVIGAVIGAVSQVRIDILDDDGPASFDPDFHPPTFDGQIHSVALADNGQIAVGGYFHYAGNLPVHSLALLSADGSLNPGLAVSFAPTWAELNVVRFQTPTNLLVAGFITSANGVPCHYMARVSTSGVVDSAFYTPVGEGFGLVAGVLEIKPLPDGTAFLGGYISGSDYQGLTQIDWSGSRTSFRATGWPGGAVGGLEMTPEGKLVVIERWGTSVRRLETNGANDTNFSAFANGTVRCVKVLPDGKVVVGGYFSGSPGLSIARLLADGSVDSSFVGGLSLFQTNGSLPNVYRMALQADGKVLVAVQMFTSPRKNYVVRLHVDGTLDTDFEPLDFAIPSGDNETIRDLVVQPDGKIIVAGEFNTVNGVPRPYLVRLKGGGNTGTRLLRMKSLQLQSAGNEITLNVQAGKRFVIETSIDLVTWSALSTNISITPQIRFTDPNGTAGPRRFYRAVHR